MFQTNSTTKCAACGKEHKSLPVTHLESPVIIDGKEYPYVMQCPETWEPIYFRVMCEEEPAVK